MKSLNVKIKESLDLKNNIIDPKTDLSDTIQKLDITVNGDEKRKIKNAIYKQLETSGSIGKFYKDKNDKGIKQIKKDIENALKTLNNEYIVKISDNAEFRISQDGLRKWKEYKIGIYMKNKDLPFMYGILNCFANGYIDDPFSIYTINCFIGF